MSGRIVDSSGNPIPFAHVQLLNSNYGTIANHEGRFQLILKTNEETSLKISCIGYKSKVIQGLNDEILVVLEEDIHMLSEVAVVPRDYAREIVEKAIGNIPINYPRVKEKHEGFLREQTFWKGDSLPIYVVESALESIKKPYLKKEINGDVSVKEHRKYESPRLDSLSIRIFAGAHHIHRFDIAAKRSEFLNDPRSYYFEIQDTLILDANNLYKVFFKRKDLDGYIYILDSTFAISKAEFRYNSFPLFDIANRSRINLRFSVFYQKNDEIWRFKNSIYSTEFKRSGKILELHSEYVTTSVSDTFNEIPYQEQIHFGDILLSKSVAYDSAFWKDYNIILPDPITEKVFKEASNQPIIKEKKKPKVIDIIRRLRTGLIIDYSPIAFNSHRVSFSNDQISIDQSGSSMQTQAINIVTMIQYRLDETLYLSLNTASHLFDPSISKLDLQLLKEINLNPRGRPILISPGISLGYQQLSKSLGNFMSSASFKINGKTFDSGSTDILLQQRGFRFMPSLSFGIEKSHRIQYFVSAGYNIQLDQKIGLVFDETDQFFLKQKKTFLENGDEGLVINTTNQLFENKWNFSFGIYLSI